MTGREAKHGRHDTLLLHLTMGGPTFVSETEPRVYRSLAISRGRSTACSLRGEGGNENGRGGGVLVAKRWTDAPRQIMLQRAHQARYSRHARLYDRSGVSHITKRTRRMFDYKMTPPLYYRLQHERYSGQWREGKKHGEGVWRWSNGRTRYVSLCRPT